MNNPKGFFLCWDCETRFKEGQVLRTVLDDGVPTSVCNKCYSLRIKNDKALQTN